MPALPAHSVSLSRLCGRRCFEDKAEAENPSSKRAGTSALLLQTSKQTRPATRLQRRERIEKLIRESTCGEAVLLVAGLPSLAMSGRSSVVCSLARVEVPVLRLQNRETQRRQGRSCAKAPLKLLLSDCLVSKAGRKGSNTTFSVLDWQAHGLLRAFIQKSQLWSSRTCRKSRLAKMTELGEPNQLETTRNSCVRECK